MCEKEHDFQIIYSISSIYFFLVKILLGFLSWISFFFDGWIYIIGNPFLCFRLGIE